MNIPNLAPEEQTHVANGGRVFIVQEITGPMWRVLMVNNDTCKVLLKPPDMDGYSDHETAMLNALATANLSEDEPLIREQCLVE